MSNGEIDRVTPLRAENLGSADTVPKIDEALRANEREREKLLELRKAAVHLSQIFNVAPQAAPPVQARERAEGDQEALRLSLRELIDIYRRDERSSFQRLRYKTRENYEHFLKRLERDFPSDKVADLTEERVLEKFNEWSSDGRLPMARSLMGTMGRVAAFGAKVLKSRDCRELQITMRDVGLPKLKSRNEPITETHFRLIVEEARKRDLASMALAQALQFEGKLAQKDVIGEWVPEEEEGESDTRNAGLKWLHGIRWEEIDANEVLHHVASRTGVEITRDLATFPTVMEEFKRIRERLGQRPTSGPVIIFEPTGRPYSAVHFRELWRKIADDCGIPRAVKNRSRADSDEDEE